MVQGSNSYGNMGTINIFIFYENKPSCVRELFEQVYNLKLLLLKMMQNRPGQGQNMPGYTGYQSAQIREEREATALAETTRRQQEENSRHQNRVPGYQGYVPSIKSENVFGDTFGSTTRQQKEGKIKAGFDCDNGERYRSVAQGVYTDQMQQHVFGTADRPVGA